MLDNGYKVFLFGDVKFFDNLLGGGLDFEVRMFLLCIIMKLNKLEVKLVVIQDYGLNVVEELKESIQNCYCYYFLLYIIFQMVIIVFVD